MKRLTLPIIAMGVTLMAAACTDQAPLAPDPSLAAQGGPHIVRVAAPTGDVATDRAAIMAALDQVGPGGTVRFAPGTYVIGVPVPGDYILVDVPRVSLLGDAGGTTLRGCEAPDIDFVACIGLVLAGERQAVRGLTFEDFGTAVVLGRHTFLPPPASEGRPGGFRVEGNTFRRSDTGIWSHGQWTQPASVRGNVFENVGSAVWFNGSILHVVDNDLSAPAPESIPGWGEAFSGVLGLAFGLFDTGPCDRNVIARNRIDGYRWGAGVELIGGSTCSHNMIQDNTITDSRVYPGFDLGAPIFIWNEDAPELMQHNVVQGNRVLGAEGVGVVVLSASHTLIVNNTFSGIAPSPDGAWLGVADGGGVWVTPESYENRILANTFSDLASYAVVLQGDRNLAAMTSPDDEVLDLGVDNRITGRGTVANLSAAGGVPGVAARMAGSPLVDGRMRDRLLSRAGPGEAGPEREPLPR